MTHVGKELALYTFAMSKNKQASRLEFLKQRAIILVPLASLASLVALGLGSNFALSSTMQWDKMQGDRTPCDLLSKESSELKLAIVPQKTLFDTSVSESAIESALNDDDRRMKEDFKVPSEIRTTVRFWLRVYTQYSTRNIAFFDHKNMDIIYEVLDFTDILARSRNLVVYEILSERKLKKTHGLYKAAFASLIKNPNPKKPTREQKIILAKIKNPTSQTLKEMNEHFKYIRGQRDNLINGLVAAESFLPKMEMIFAKNQVPVEFTRLSLVESSFNLKATSKVGASGVWQFMPNIGKKFMTIDDQLQVDERRSPLKSTIAAAKMLKWNHHYLGSWTLAVIAYNHGLKNLPRYKNREASFKEISHLFVADQGKKSLGWASRSYYAEFLGALYAENYRHLFYGEIPKSGIRPVTYVQLLKKESAVSFANRTGAPLKDFLFLNSDIQNMNQVLPKGFWIALPNKSDDIQNFVKLALAKRGK